MQMSRVIEGAFDHCMHGYFLEAGDVAESDGFAEETQYIASSRSSQRAVFVVGGGAFPRSESG
jgi:hypothetical protein